MIYFNGMNNFSMQEYLYLALSITVLCVGVFLCWALCELAKLLHQVNETVSETRNKMKRLEMALESIKEHFSSLSSYAALVAQAGKAVSGYFSGKETEHKHKGKKSLEEILSEE